MADEKTVSTPATVVPIGRSVNYPTVSLQNAIKLAKKFYAGAHKHSIPVATAAKVWEFGEKSSSVRSTISTLKQFGIMADSGDGEKREVRLTERGLDIAMEPDDSPKRAVAIQSAVKTPKIYKEIFDKFGGEVPASDHLISSFLIREKDFNPKVVDDLIKDFRTSLATAKLSSSDKMPADPAGQARNPPTPSPVKEGDFVQCEIGGVLQFVKPRKVVGLSPDGLFVFVEGSPTGLPVGGITVQTPAIDVVHTPPPNPHLGATILFEAAEKEWLRGPLSKETNYRLIVAGDIGPKEIGRLIKILTAQKEVLEDADD